MNKKDSVFALTNLQINQCIVQSNKASARRHFRTVLFFFLGTYNIVTICHINPKGLVALLIV